jgi:hypothetical protein
MKIKRIVSTLIAVVLSLGAAVNCFASGGYYLPDVTGEMSSPFFWTNEADVLMSFDEIEKLNEATISAKGTNMYNLKNQPDTVDGIALNEAIYKSSQADAAYYLGWTYLGKEKLATEKEFDKLVQNTQNKNAKKNQKVKYIQY